MRFRTMLWAVAVALCCSTLAQPVEARWYRRGRGRGYGGYGVSTPASANMMGMSSVIRAQGQYNLATSRALMNYQQARSRYIDNQVKWQQAYHTMRRSAEAYWEQDREQRAAVRDRWLASRGSGQPAPLSPSQFNPHTGAIHWPAVLSSPEFAANRSKIEDLFGVRAHTSSATTAHTQIRATLREMSAQLRSEIHELPPHEYLTGRKFLDALEGESAVHAG